MYRAANRSVPEVAKELIAERKPKQASKEDENPMFLVYSDKMYNLQKDKEKPSDTLIEISNEEFVRQNYQPSFLQGYIMGSILNDIFGSRKSSYGDYRGYNDRQNHKPVIPERSTYEIGKENPTSNYEGRERILIIKRGDNVDPKSSVGDKGSITEKEVKRRHRLLPEAKENHEKSRWLEPTVKPKSSIKTPPKNSRSRKQGLAVQGKLSKRR